MPAPHAAAPRPVALAAACAAALAASACFSAPRYRGPRSDHFDGRVFHTPRAPGHQGALGLIGWQLTRERARWSAWTASTPGPAPPRRVGAGQLRVTFINHATTLVQLDGLNVLTDPIYSERASPLSWIGPRRVRAPGIRFDDLPPIDVVVISHNHYDHLDLPTLRRLARRDHPRFLVPLGNAALLAQVGLDRVTERDWWQDTALGAHVRAVAVPTVHFSGRGAWDTDATLWCGWLLLGPGGPVYFAGDTAYGWPFAEVRRRFGRPRLAILPIGAFRPRWFMKAVHMSPDDALRAHADLGAATSVAMHFGTFPLADDGQYEAPELLGQALDALDPRPRFWILDFGEGRDVPALPPAPAPR